MPASRSSLRADKSRAYFDSLCKHFARKVEVQREGDRACIAFPMGECTLWTRDDVLGFEACAADAEALEAVKSIIALHVLRFSAFKDTEVIWE